MQPPPAFVTVQEFYEAKGKLEDRIARLEEREKVREKTWVERLAFVAIIVGLLVAFFVRR
jgi:hypothetical protein